MTGQDAVDVERRRRAVEDARRSSELEGSRSSDATRADQDAFVRGEIDAGNWASGCGLAIAWSDQNKPS